MDYTHNVMLAYAVLNAAWAVTCVIIIVAAVMHVRSWFAYVPWILVTAANIVLDVVATIKFASDAVEAETPKGLIETVIGVDLHLIPEDYKKEFYSLDVFKQMEGLSMIPSLVMVLLSSRLVIFWLLSVMCLICVFVAICRFSKEKGKKKELTTYPYNQPRGQDFRNTNSYLEEPITKEANAQHDYTYAPGYSTPYPYTGGDFKTPFSRPPQPLTNKDPASRVAVPGTNLQSPTTQPYYMELLEPKPRYHNPSAPTDNYERQPLNSLPVSSDIQRNYGPNEQRRAPHIDRTESERTSQPPIKNRPNSSVAIPRVDLRSSLPEPDPEYLEPRQEIHNSLPSADNYELPPLPRLPVPGDVKRNNGPEEQRKASHIRRTDSERPALKPLPSTTNLHGRPTYYEEVKPLERKTSQTPQDRPQDTNRNTDRRLSGSLPRPSGSLLSDELRSQLPWSYFGPRDAPMKPKPKQDPVAEEELEMPPMPVPDYTLHFGKMARPVTSKWSDDGESSTAPRVADLRGTSASGVDRSNSLLKRNRY